MQATEKKFQFIIEDKQNHKENKLYVVNEFGKNDFGPGEIKYWPTKLGHLHSLHLFNCFKFWIK